MIYKHVGCIIVTIGSIPNQIFDVFLYLFGLIHVVILPYYNAISVDFYAVKGLIYIYFV